MKHAGLLLPEGIDPSWRVGVVASCFYAEEMDALIAGARDTLQAGGIGSDAITLHAAPGSFEVPLIGAALAEKDAVDALIGLGIVVEGETHHARLLAGEAARGIMDVQLRYRLPFAFEILYVRSLAQARERASGEANKGAEAACSVLHSLVQLHGISS